MKYKLIIEGTKEEIELSKTYGQWRVYQQLEVAQCPEVEYKIVEPKYRYRTADELWAEIIHPAMESGEYYSVSGDNVWIDINGCKVLRADFGNEVKGSNIRFHGEWSKIFLKEIE